MFFTRQLDVVIGTTRTRQTGLKRRGGETMRWLLGGMCLTLILRWRRSCSFWQDIKTKNLPSLSSVFTQGDADMRGQPDQEDAPILTWGKSYSRGEIYATLQEPTGGGRMWVGASGRGQELSGLMRRDVSAFTLSSPQSPIKRLKAMTNPRSSYFQCTDSQCQPACGCILTFAADAPWTHHLGSLTAMPVR